MKPILLLVLAALAGCEPGPQPIAASQTSNGYNVEKLFTHDGCTVYRFEDGRSRYFVRCANGDQRVEFDDKVTRRTGKTTSTTYCPQTISTSTP